MPVLKYIITPDEAKKIENKCSAIQEFISAQGFFPSTFTYSAVVNTAIKEAVGWIVEFKTFLPKQPEKENVT